MKSKTLFVLRPPHFRPFGLVCATIFAPAFAYSMVFLTVFDNGDSTTDWTLSGSGVMPNGLFHSNTAAITFPEFTTGAYTNPSAGNSANQFSINGVSADKVQVGDFGGSDLMELSFVSSLGAGTDLSTATGTITFPIDFATLSLPVTASSFHFGTITIQSEVPEPSAIPFLVGIVAAVAGLRRRRS